MNVCPDYNLLEFIHMFFQEHTKVWEIRTFLLMRVFISLCDDEDLELLMMIISQLTFNSLSV